MSNINIEWYKSLPKKRMGAGALILNEQGEVLIVKSHDKDWWSVPGGVVEAWESPRNACIREVKEEIGIELSDVQFLCVDWHSNTLVDTGDSLQFIFSGGTLSQTQIERITIQTNELAEFRFVHIDTALPLFHEKLRRMVPKCLRALRNKTAVYLEDGE